LRPANCIQYHKKKIQGSLTTVRLKCCWGEERGTERQRERYIFIKKIGEKEERKSGKNSTEITRQLWLEIF